MSDELELVADCSRCFGLCCVLLPFSASSGFGMDKASGVACHHLQGDDRCEIHASLREDGWPGCAAFDCFGAGQHVSQGTYAGTSWRSHDNLGEMAAVLSVMRQLHEMVAHLAEAVRRAPDEATQVLLDDLTRRTAGTAKELLALDLDELRRMVGPVLVAASAGVREPHTGRQDLRGADLAGQDQSERDLRGADLRGALLIRTDLGGTDLTDADLLGADLRDADVRGADLSRALFLSQAQVNAALGDAATHLPERLTRPAHWG
ncbi:MAG: pentapeptide repeat-containing protein [Nocardioides sp.]